MPRTADDSWDIATSVGATAVMVALARAAETASAEPLISDRFAEVLVSTPELEGVREQVAAWWTPEPDDEAADFTVDARRMINYQAVRTHFFDAYFAGAASAGVRQVVILAAGLDSRAYRLDWPAGTTIFELDRPQVLDFKREVLAGHGAPPRAERREIAVDLREDWPQALRDNGFDPARPSAWIAEGLLIYLPAAAQEQLFTGIDGLAGHGSHVAIEDGAPLEPDEFEAAIEEERAAAAEGDQRLFFRLVYNERHAPVTEWFGQRGWTAVDTPLADYLRQVGRPVPGPDTGAGPMIARNTLVSAVKD